MARLASRMAWSACSAGLSPKKPEQPASSKVESKITPPHVRRFMIGGMSEGSLPPFGVPLPRSVPRAVGRVLGRLFGKPRRKKEAAPGPTPGRDPALERRVAAVISRHAGANATLFERAERLTEKTTRLERAGTPSDSASNRAARARGEVEAGLATLRASFVDAEGDEGGRAFDREVARRYPELGLTTSGTDA